MQLEVPIILFKNILIRLTIKQKILKVSEVYSSLLNKQTNKHRQAVKPTSEIVKDLQLVLCL